MASKKERKLPTPSSTEWPSAAPGPTETPVPLSGGIGAIPVPETTGPDVGEAPPMALAAGDAAGEPPAGGDPVDGPDVAIGVATAEGTGMGVLSGMPGMPGGVATGVVGVGVGPGSSGSGAVMTTV